MDKQVIKEEEDVERRYTWAAIKARLSAQCENAHRYQGVYRRGTPEYEYWRGAYEWLDVASKMINKVKER